MDPIKWAILGKKAIDGESIACPKCGGNVKADFYARIIDGEKRGFIILECEKCNERIHFSRIKFPDNLETKDY